MKVAIRLSRGGEVVVKAGHAALREGSVAPEQRAARRLAADVARHAPPVTGPRVAFLTPRSWASHVQWEAVIAQSLRMRGADVSFVTCGGGLGICDRSNTWESPGPPCRTCSRYVRDSLTAHGFDQAPLADHWGAFGGPGDGGHDDGADAWPELDSLGIDELASVEFAGLPLGRIVEIPVKWFLLRSDLTGDPLAAVTYRRFLRSARAIAGAVGAELDRSQPDVVVLCNGLFLFEAIVFELCRRRGIDVVTYERGLIKETLLFRLNAVACLMDITPAWEQWKDTPLTPAEEAQLNGYLDERRHGKRTIDRYWDDVVFADREPAAAGRRSLTLLPNLTWDSAVIGQAAAYDGLEGWIVDTISTVAARHDTDLTIRIHPAETKLPGKQTREPVRDIIDRHFPELPACVTVIGSDDPTSSYSILEGSDVAVVFSSTTGLEATLMGTPVIVAGRTHYRGKGFTLDADDPAGYVDALTRLLDDPSSFTPDVELARRYAHLLFFRVPVTCPGAEEHVLGLARLTATDAASVAPGADPSLDRICDGILHRRDFPC